ncbi:spermine/spermidine synthase family protein [Pseudovirgaria hyperparasitica]|uniref:Spermine/spermidine synthase family protein n=1 Tax=Pseudovirgaria hyperparasitica TaxID=470096 RepID=A0A6A6W7A1_9PEZI|nr:spermine/spermidine synthase family protein [Pseudovirgaria hyperparasitica]KAF2758425.1 spermine/spermidine synthase family protein [Pseudovirgaria hyperparasitica]
MAPQKKGTQRKAQAVRKEALKTEPSVLSNVGKAVLLLAVAGAATTVSQLSLSPVYGSIPSALFHQRAVTGTALSAVMARHSRTLKRYVPRNLSEFIPLLAYWIPPIQFIMFKLSGHLGPIYGPLITEMVTYLPLLFMVVYAAGDLIDTIDLRQLQWNSTVIDMIGPVLSYIIVTISSKVTALQLPGAMSTNQFLTRSGLQLLLASIFAAASTSFWVVLAVPAMIHTMIANPHYHGVKATAALNSTLAVYNYTILERRESLTGYVSVLEDHNNYFRILRCDHSLLGGNWLLTPERIAQGFIMPETIYSVFTMLEAVRLVETPKPKPDSEKSALVIGLGIGTAPSAMIAHGINTTIVELDPAVLEFASKYFDLPDNHTAAVMDAVAFINEVAVAAPSSYDFVIHDVFTGGAEPAALFTTEFLQGIRTVLRKDGVVAINYAGDMSLPSTQIILNTIHHVFPTCRIFRDSPEQTKSASSDTDFINMVVFCTNAPDGSNLVFREPNSNDWKGSVARRNYLYPRPDLEIKYEFKGAEATAKLLRKGETAELERHQNEAAISHWRIMRTVLPAGVWENW